MAPPNIRLTRTDIPIEFDDDIPFMQVQPMKRAHTNDAFLSRFEVEGGVDEFTAEDWDRYAETVVKPNTDPNRRRGAYAAKVRKEKSVPSAAE